MDKIEYRGVTWHIWWIKYTHLMLLSELEAKDPAKIPDVQTLNSSINFFLIIPNIIIYHVMFFY